MTELPWYIYILFAGQAIIVTLISSRVLADWRADKRADKKEVAELHKTSHGKEVDADVAALKLLADRLKILESRVDTLQDKLGEEMARSSRLTAENEALKTENERQARRIHDFATEFMHKDKEILDLRLALQQTQSDLAILRKEFETLQNGRVSELIDMSKSASHAQGKLEERNEQAARNEQAGDEVVKVEVINLVDAEAGEKE